jgi:predicted ABC-type ATPase
LVQSGYEAHLFYFWLESPELAISRVAARVAKGGHNVAEDTIRQRYDRSIKNLFELYMPVVTSWKVYDNSGPGDSILVAKGARSGAVNVLDADRWSRIRMKYDDA